MTSKMKWNLIPLVGFVLSVSLYLYLLGSILAVIVAPIMALFAGWWVYGAIDKTGFFDAFFNWMNKD